MVVPSCSNNNIFLKSYNYKTFNVYRVKWNIMYVMTTIIIVTITTSSLYKINSYKTVLFNGLWTSMTFLLIALELAQNSKMLSLCEHSDTIHHQLLKFPYRQPGYLIVIFFEYSSFKNKRSLQVGA